jgi:hypothetical protein
LATKEKTLLLLLIAKAKMVKFLESILCFCVAAFRFVGCQEGKGGGYFIKDPKEINMAHVYRILRSDSLTALCQSQFLKKMCRL